MLIKILILIAMVKFLRESQSPLTCAVIYGVLAFFFTIIFNNTLTQALIAGIVGGALSFVYFWLLHKFEDSILWWVILLGGFAIGLV